MYTKTYKYIYQHGHCLHCVAHDNGSLVEADRALHLELLSAVPAPPAEHIDDHRRRKERADVVIDLGIAAAAMRHHKELYVKPHENDCKDIGT